MAIAPNSALGRLLHRRSLARWQRAAARAEGAELRQLSAEAQMAQQLLRPLQELDLVARTRLARPRAGSAVFPRPAGTDWSHRPKPWRVRLPEKGAAPVQNKTRLSDELRVFHDCPLAQIALRQSRNTRDVDLAPFGLSLDVLGFQGSYLSLVIEVPPAACDGLRRRHLIRLACVIERERHSPIQARLNIRHGPNTEQLLLPLPDDGPEIMVEFDLAYSQLNEKRAEAMWIDLLIGDPALNRILIRDLTLSRYPRAEI